MRKLTARTTAPGRLFLMTTPPNFAKKNGDNVSPLVTLCQFGDRAERSQTAPTTKKIENPGKQPVSM
jgi:hypothetical protein